MKLEIMALCDAATVSGGKLNILGAFDSIQAPQLPIVHPFCTLALRLRFSRVEEGDHQLRLSMVDADGRPLFPNIDGKMSVRFTTDEESVAGNFLINMQALKFEREGAYAIELAVDGRHEGSLPLAIRTGAMPPST